ncbi:MAG: hypothetical protein M3Y56_15850, partial [Armatimonadota bacterium]|nr:hypothetical protein [Armatimonadota bacterium]
MKTSTTLIALLSLGAFAQLASAAQPSPRQRILMDANWRFFRGEVPGDAPAPQGTPVTQWRWTADDAGEADAAKMADPALDVSGPTWKDAATGDETFHGRVGFSWYRTTLPAIRGP